MNIRHELGHVAEDRAAEYIQSLGWKIIGRNMRNRYGELDIVAIDPKCTCNITRVTSAVVPRELVIVEVRCRTIGRVQSPIESVGPTKLRRLVRAGEKLVESMNWLDYWRIDIVGFTVPLKRSENWKLEHVRDITAGLNLGF